ncbi:hypothetical protein BV20DRAFT_230466 [Pilatotrama ljubarskyi]|nr:hypothetical protein BV20DRAFT_230466 [Pilatotrama ljubarskyi]
MYQNDAVLLIYTSRTCLLSLTSLLCIIFFSSSVSLPPPLRNLLNFSPSPLLPCWPWQARARPSRYRHNDGVPLHGDQPLHQHNSFRPLIIGAGRVSSPLRTFTFVYSVCRYSLVPYVLYTLRDSRATVVTTYLLCCCFDHLLTAPLMLAGWSLMFSSFALS